MNQVVWYSGPHYLNTCPVLHLSARVIHALRWFDLTHDCRIVGMGNIMWEMTQLPYPGGVGAQPHWLMRALEAIRAERNLMIQESRKRDTNPEQEPSSTDE